MKPITQDTRNNIISLLNARESTRQIASQLGVSHTTVNNIRLQSMPDTQKTRRGRPSKLTAVDKRMLVRMVTSGQADNASQLKHKLHDTVGVDISTKTIRRALKQSGLKAVVKKKKPRLSARHIRQRLDFALQYQNWTVEDWKRVIWSDETKINRLGSDGREWVWKKPNSSINDQQIQGTVKFGGGSLMIWGCMTAKGAGYACRINGRMDAQLYTNILDDELIQTLQYYELDRKDIVFQQDNDPKHTSSLARQWFENNDIEVLPWPPQSPDLNPIEHLWQSLKRRLAAYETEPTGMHELWQRVEAEWNNIPMQECLDLIESMPRRISAVVKAKGGHTQY
jgi:transposase